MNHLLSVSNRLYRFLPMHSKGNPASVLILNWNWRFWSLMIYIMLEFHLHHHEQPVQFERRSCNNIDCTLYTALKRRDQSSKIAIKCHFEQKLCFEEKTTWKIHSVFIFCTTQFCAMTDDCTNPSFYSFTFLKLKLENKTKKCVFFDIFTIGGLT